MDRSTRRSGSTWGLFHQYGISGPANNWRWDEETRGVAKATSAYQYPQASACFIQSVSDDMEGIMRLAKSEAMLFKFGSGTGTDLSTLRSSREKLSGGGKPSGPVSFMRVYDAIASVVKSGGKTRRAAKMQTLKCWHPDILEFIECKTKEEKKAQSLDPRRLRGQLQRRSLQLGDVSELEPVGPLHRCIPERGRGRRRLDHPRGHDRPADGYVQGADADGQDRRRNLALRRPRRPVRRHHPALAYLPNTAPINSSNPCSEYMFIDDSACNLASINLMKFRREDGSFDAERFRAAVRIFITAQEILVDHASYPTDRITANSHKFRPLGLGYANLGSLLMASGLPYDSEEGRALAAAITAIMHGQAYLTSAEHAAHVGAFDGFAVNREPMLHVMEMHRDAAEAIDRSAPADLLGASAGRLGRVPRHGPQARLSQQPGHGAGPDRHDRLHDGLRYDRNRARHRAREVQATRRRRHAQDCQPNRADGPAQAGLRRAGDPRNSRLHRLARHDRGIARV